MATLQGGASEPLYKSDSGSLSDTKPVKLPSLLCYNVSACQKGAEVLAVTASEQLQACDISHKV